MSYDLTKDEDVCELAKKINKEARKRKVELIDENVPEINDEMFIRLMMTIDTISFVTAIKAFVSCAKFSEDNKKDIKLKKDYINALLNKMKEEILITIKNPEKLND